MRKSGQADESITKRLQSAKMPKTVDCNSCRYKCTAMFNDEFRNSLCRHFHSLSYKRQKDMLLNLVTVCPVVRKRKGVKMVLKRPCQSNILLKKIRKKSGYVNNFFKTLYRY